MSVTHHCGLSQLPRRRFLLYFLTGRVDARTLIHSLAPSGTLPLFPFPFSQWFSDSNPKDFWGDKGTWEFFQTLNQKLFHKPKWIQLHLGVWPGNILQCFKSIILTFEIENFCMKITSSSIPRKIGRVNNTGPTLLLSNSWLGRAVEHAP